MVNTLCLSIYTLISKYVQISLISPYNSRYTRHLIFMVAPLNASVFRTLIYYAPLEKLKKRWPRPYLTHVHLHEEGRVKMSSDTIARTISELIQDPRFRIPLAALKGFRNGLVWVAHTLQCMHAAGTLGISFFRMAWASCDSKINHRSAVYNLRINRYFIVMLLAELQPLIMHLLKVQRQPRQARVIYRVWTSWVLF